MGKTKNGINDLNNLLFEQLEKLNDADNLDDLSIEIERSKAITGISTQIINNGKLAIEAQKLIIDNAGMKDEYQAKLPEFLE